MNDFTQQSFWPKEMSSRIGLLVSLGVIVYFFGFFEVSRGIQYNRSTMEWALDAWNKETDMEHGILFPFLIAGMLFLKRVEILKVFRASETTSSGHGGRVIGLVVILLGCVGFMIAYRTIQPRISMAALPVLLSGCVCYLWGLRVAVATAFPLFFFWLAIPLPSFQQATVGLQHISTALAQDVASLIGVQTVVKGTEISAADGSWGNLSVAGGCSGIRSLMALLMIAGAYAYLAKMVIWKKGLLVVAAIPIAVLANSLRIGSICAMAGYVDTDFATGTWHDWSGLFLFFPVSLCLLMLLHSVLESKTSPFALLLRKTRKKTVTKRVAR